MILNLAKHENIGGIERGVYYFNLSEYPQITDQELKYVVAFIKYEKSYGRQTDIVCEDKTILEIVNHAAANPETVESIFLPDESKFVYHGTDIFSAKKILTCGKLLAATKVYAKSADELAYEKRGSQWNDPADFFEYIMFSRGNDITGDLVVLSENFPAGEDIESGNFNAGVRFYFRSADIVRHPGHVYDGYHPIKVKDEISLIDYLFACIVPEQYKAELDGFITPELTAKVHYLAQRGMSLAEWNDKVYKYSLTLTSRQPL